MHQLFDTTRPFFRGNLHTHSTLSDGVLEPAEVCRRYRAEGYDFMALTDHFVGLYGYPIADTVPFRTEGFTTLLGAELHSGPLQNGEVWHILAVGLPADFTPARSPDFFPTATQETGPEIARRAVEAGAFVAIAHPHWSGLTQDDARSLEAAHAVEVYNHGCATGCDRGEGFLTLDLLLSEGRRLTAVATDDAHFSEPDHFGGWVMVNAPENTPEALLAALKTGDHYSTQGPEFRQVSWDEHQIVVECSAVASVIVQGHGCAALAHHGHSITRATITLSRFAHSPWIRVTLIDAAGRRAWSNPIWRDIA
ncbi:MAG: CehA/McbA family metallohydrolase [Paracoccaceae bacterium]|nr:CehA/McbA family metallohydrolase [Paracoccaceae bacterium]